MYGGDTMIYSVDNLLPMTIGRRHNAFVSEILFDCDPWLAKYPHQETWKIEVVSPCGKQYSPLVSIDNNILKWMITQDDTKCTGRGSYQIVATGGETQITSSHQDIFVLSDMQSSASSCCECCDQPMTAEQATEEMLEMLEKAEAAARQAETAVEQLEDCEICNDKAFLIFDGGTSVMEEHSEVE